MGILSYFSLASQIHLSLFIVKYEHMMDMEQKQQTMTKELARLFYWIPWILFFDVLVICQAFKVGKLACVENSQGWISA